VSYLALPAGSLRGVGCLPAAPQLQLHSSAAVCQRPAEGAAASRACKPATRRLPPDLLRATAPPFPDAGSSLLSVLPGSLRQCVTQIAVAGCQNPAGAGRRATPI